MNLFTKIRMTFSLDSKHAYNSMGQTQGPIISYSLFLILLFALLLTLLTSPLLSGCSTFSSPENQTESNEMTDNKEENLQSLDNREEKNQNPQKTDLDETHSEDKTDKTHAHKPTELRISAVGDVMVHKPQLNAQFDRDKEVYDFNNNFKYIKPFIKQSDLALANLETVLAGEEEKFTGFPLFNTPDALADALNTAGFQVLSTANNHSLDRGKQGIRRTLEVIEDRGMEAIGTRRNADENSYLLKDVEDVTIGLSAYTYETPRRNGQRTINGIPMSEETEKLLDSFNPDALDQDMESMIERAELLQDKGADLVVFFMHWGQEYHRYPDTFQESIAQALVENGVDIIFGSHPHVIQPVDEIKTESGERGIVIHSMGNFLSNQRSEYMDNPYTEDGIIFHVDILRDSEGNVSIDAVKYTPTWVQRYQENGALNYHILPLPHALEDNEKYGLYNERDLNKAQRAWDNTRSILEEGSYEPKLDEIR